MNRPVRFICNRQEVETLASPGTTALDFIRNEMSLTGTKEGCREGECGACVILLGSPASRSRVKYRAVNSCLVPLGDLDGHHAVTIEGVNPEASDEERPFGRGLTPIQEAFVDEGATQCGFCTPGFIMSLTWFFLESKELPPAEALDAVSGNICRCTGYASIKRSIGNLLDSYRDRLLEREDRIEALIEEGFLPPYFTEIPERIKTLSLTGGPESSRGRPGIIKDAAETELPEEEQVRYIVAGGTDLLVQRPESIVDAPLKLLTDREEMSGIIIEDDAVKIGAAVPMEDLSGNEVLARTLPRLKEYLHLIAASPIRQRATLAGNIVNASPIGDMSILLLALKGFLILSSDSGDGEATRTVRLKDFFRGYKDLDLWQNEVVRWVCFPLPKKTSVENFEKVSRRTYLDIASVNSAVQMDVEGKEPILRNVSLAAGGVAPVPLYLKDTSALLEGKPLTVNLVKRAGDSARNEVSPISDVRGSAEYKRKLVRRLVLAHFTTLFPETISWEELE